MSMYVYAPNESSHKRKQIISLFENIWTFVNNKIVEARVIICKIMVAAISRDPSLLGNVQKKANKIVISDMIHDFYSSFFWS